MAERYKTFPPRRGGVRAPVGSRRGAMAAVALYPACRPSALWVRRLAWTGVRLLGPRVLPGPAEAWRPPTGEPMWRSLEAQWREEIGPWEAMAVFERLQPGREGLGILLAADGARGAYVKLRREAGGIDRERRALEAVAAHGPRAFTAPAPIAWGAAGGWHWLAMAALPAGLHRPPSDPPLAGVLADVEAALRSLPRPAEAQSDWRPMHGDMTPWNLRRLSGAGPSRLALVDWEEAGWGPPGADEVLYRAVEAALAGRPPRPVAEGDEAARHWRAVFRSREGSGRDGRLAAGVLSALGAMMENGR